jgi:DNA-binding CsgD family transcriptional regulator
MGHLCRLICRGLAVGKGAVAIDLTAIERRELESLASRRKTAQGLAQRARIVLLAAEGAENKDVSLRLGAAPNTVGKWRRRFAKSRIGPSRRASSRRAAPDRR